MLVQSGATQHYRASMVVSMLLHLALRCLTCARSGQKPWLPQILGVQQVLWEHSGWNLGFSLTPLPRKRLEDALHKAEGLVSWQRYPTSCYTLQICFLVSWEHNTKSSLEAVEGPS